MVLGHILIKEFLENTGGVVRGQLLTDAKQRYYAANYRWREDEQGYLRVARRDGRGDEVLIPTRVELDESLVAFFGFYSGDGAKGSENSRYPGRVRPTVSISQTEPNLIRFAIQQFRRLFPGSIQFTFSLGEDSAWFMAGEGREKLEQYYGGKVPDVPALALVRPILNTADRQYLTERRSVAGTNEEHLAFYYFHQSAMEDILTQVKQADLNSAGIVLGSGDRVTASMRRPFKKGARVPGGSSRADETVVGGITGLGELFLKMLHELEDSLLADSAVSTQGLICWNDTPSQIGQIVDVYQFFSSHPFGQLGGERPTFQSRQLFDSLSGEWLCGRWPRSKQLSLHPTLRLDPLWCYTAGLYLAEGRSNKAALFQMYRTKPSGFGLGFTSSENTSLELMLRALNRLFRREDCLDAWKVKVGSQYFPELVVVGLKNGVPMLRGGQSGDGKLRTMEISLAIKQWALGVAPALADYADKYSHVEPTGAGIPRIDFWASPALCRWYFPLIMYAVFGQTITNPATEFSS